MIFDQDFHKKPQPDGPNSSWGLRVAVQCQTITINYFFLALATGFLALAAGLAAGFAGAFLALGAGAAAFLVPFPKIASYPEANDLSSPKPTRTMLTVSLLNPWWEEPGFFRSF